MRPAKRTKRLASAVGRTAEATASEGALDELTRELIDLFAQLIARGNVEREAAAEYLKTRLNVAPAARHRVRQHAGRAGVRKNEPDQTFLPSEVITQWHHLSDFLSNGQPRPLKARGSRLSIASLVRRVNARADPDEVLKYLLATSAVKRVGNHYVPTTRMIKHQLVPVQQQMHHERLTLALLRTVEWNARHAEGAADESGEQSRAYQSTTTGFIPESQMQEFRTEIRQLNDVMLVLVDGAMARRAQERKQGERLVPVSEAIFISENSPLAPLPAATRKVRRGKPT
jgi:hypothetical protein